MNDAPDKIEHPEEDAFERCLQLMGLDAPRLSPALIDSPIAKADYHHFPGTQSTVCCITLINGTTVIGDSACASPENFNAGVGEEVAFKEARNKIWTVAGTALVDVLAGIQGRPTITGKLIGSNLIADAIRDQINPPSEFDAEEWIASVAHEINRTYCTAIGDDSQPAWDDAPEWQRKSAIDGVKYHMANPDATPESSHVNWMQQKELDGWRYGPVKNPETKEHPCFMPYHDLPVEQRVKDYLFRAVIHLLK